MDNIKNKNILITAGATREFIDPVRYISNPSTGKMGIAIADTAHKAGANVTLILGPTYLKPASGIKLINVVSAEEMYNQVHKSAPSAEIIIMTAAVSDYKPAERHEQKVKKTEDEIALHLVKTKDILASLKEIYPDMILIGFAAESQKIKANAIKKLKSKNLDMIIANDITKKDTGFESDTNSVIIIDKNLYIEETPLLTKLDLANIILSKIKY